MEAQKNEMEFQERLLYSSIKAQEHERERIAREMHDEIGSKLNVINLGLHRLADEKNAEIVSDLFSAINSTIKTTRQISYDLLPPTLENFGLALALEELCDNHQKSSDITISFQVNKSEQLIKDFEVRLAFYRITQELITNSFKHSGASQISIDLWIEENYIVLLYKDNGKGFDILNPGFKMGLGLQNIESRIRMINATKKINSQNDDGFSIEITKLL